MEVIFLSLVSELFMVPIIPMVCIVYLLTYNLLTIASFRIGVPSILLLSNVQFFGVKSDTINENFLNCILNYKYDKILHTINSMFSLSQFWWNTVISEFSGTQSSLDFGGYCSKIPLSVCLII